MTSRPEMGKLLAFFTVHCCTARSVVIFQAKNLRYTEKIVRTAPPPPPPTQEWPDVRDAAWCTGATGGSQQFRGRIQRKTLCTRPYAGVDYITSPYVHCRVDSKSNTFAMGKPMPESTLSRQSGTLDLASDRSHPLSFFLSPPFHAVLYL